ncbi:MAG: class II aldolase/adducin family protein [Thermoproteota archaeon]
MGHSSVSEMDLKRSLVKYAHAIYNSKLATGPGGTLSARLPGSRIIFVKPSGFNLGDLTPEDFVGVDLETLKVVKGNLRPSMEVGVLAQCHLVRDDVNAVIHAHPPFCIALSSTGISINTPMYPDHVVFLEEIATLPFYVPGSKELARAVRKAVKKHNCIFLKNHGVITVGSSLREAYYRLEIMEESAKIIVFSYALSGPNRKPSSLSKKQAIAIMGLKAETYRRKLTKNW